MKEKKIKIDTNTFLADVVDNIRKGYWKIPRFQREFVWEKSKVVELLDSMYKGFPIGSFFLWLPPEEYSTYYKNISELNIEQSMSKHYEHFILDGQQRLTSLYVTYRGLSIGGFNYSNICFDLDKEVFNTERKDNERNLSVYQILNSDDYLHIYNMLSDNRKIKFMKFKSIFSKYPFPVIIIEDKNIEQACKIFERINQGGKKLSIFDLVVAVTWDKDFELKNKIDDFNNPIKNIFEKIDYEVFSELLSLIINGQCTKAFQIKMKPKDVKDKWDDVVLALKESLQFLRQNMSVKTYSYLPYRDMLALIAYYFYKCNDEKLKPDKVFLEEWFWKVSLSNRYSTSPFTKMGEDRAYIFDRKIKEKRININYDISINLDKIKTINMGRKTALRNTLILLMIQQKPLSFIDNSPVDIEKDAISEFNRSEKHHIFPRSFLKNQGIKDKKATELVVNFTLIDSKLNKEIAGKAPSDYFLYFSNENNKLNETLKSHLIPEDKNSPIWTNNYEQFIHQRAELLLRQIKVRIGDITATIEQQMNDNPAVLIQKVEQEIRESINAVLYDSYGENWWNVESVIPKDVYHNTEEKIKKEKASKPYINEKEWALPMRRLEQVNIPDYFKIININWNLFEHIYGSKQNIEKYSQSLSNIRNQINHNKTIDSTEKKFGETSIEWFLKCIQKSKEETIDIENEDYQNFMYLNNVYQKIRDEIFSLDPKIVEKEKKYYKAFNKDNSSFNFAHLQFRKDYIQMRIYVNKKKFNDPRNISEDRTRNDNNDVRKMVFKIRSKDEIPYAMELLKQSYEFNEWYLSQKKSDLKQREIDRYKFWEGLIEKAKEKNANFQNLSPSYYHYIGKRIGKPGISFNFVILNHKSSIEIYIDIGDKEKNKERFDKLFKHKNEIEKLFGDTLNWERLNTKRACRISQIYENGLKNVEYWSQLQEIMVVKMITFQKSIEKYLLELNDND